MAIKTLIVVGTRPEAIKMAPVAIGLAADSKFDSRICVTAQHREMLDQVLRLFELKPDHDLDLMKSNQDLYDITCGALLGIRKVLSDVRPDIVLVHGDTTTCFAASLAAFYEGVMVAHVEAGLRTGNMRAPYPEEANRSLVGRLATLHFAPTERARRSLLNENVPESQVLVTGNTVIDALLLARAKIDEFSPDHWSEHFGSAITSKILGANRRILITGHRRENFGRGFEDLCSAIADLAQRHPDWVSVYPVHLNPNVQEPVNRILSRLPNVILTRPQDYLPFIWLMSQADLVLTDSGGIQEEAPSLGKPVLVMREVTERPEAVEAGTVKLVGTSRNAILENVESILTDPALYDHMALATNPYGDGLATRRILSRLKEFPSA
ncbi:MAG: non-hydrolyzing UDP-N-acetylglucosamine 2-epimerase [Pseudomonadales bacterium]